MRGQCRLGAVNARLRGVGWHVTTGSLRLPLLITATRTSERDAMYRTNMTFTMLEKCKINLKSKRKTKTLQGKRSSQNTRSTTHQRQGSRRRTPRSSCSTRSRTRCFTAGRTTRRHPIPTPRRTRHHNRHRPNNFHVLNIPSPINRRNNAPLFRERYIPSLAARTRQVRVGDGASPFAVHAGGPGAGEGVCEGEFPGGGALLEGVGLAEGVVRLVVVIVGRGGGRAGLAGLTRARGGRGCYGC